MDLDQELLTIVYADLIENAGEMMWPVLSEIHNRPAMALFESLCPTNRTISHLRSVNPSGHTGD